MMKTCVILNDMVINVGDWDYQYNEIDGEMVARNPLPEGAIIEERDFVQDADGGWRLASDYQALRRAEYPPIGDQLDALWKGGEYASEMQSIVMSVKAKYPKPEV